jgi:hypothetical protein
VAGCFGTLGALALHWTMFLTVGGDAKHLLSEVALLWAAAGFAWVGSIAALVFEAAPRPKSGRDEHRWTNRQTAP